MLGAIGGILGGIGSLFGDKSKSTQSFSRDSTTTTNATAQDLSPDLLKSLEALFKGQIGGSGFSDSTGAIDTRLKQLSQQALQPQFDVAGFASGISRQAEAAAGLDLESSINGMLSASGGSEGGNSMNALLANKMRNTTAANLAGISSQATATGENIRQTQQNSITSGIQGLGGTLADQLLKLIQGTRGASNTGQSTSHEKTKGTGTDTSTSSTNPFTAIGNIFGSFAGAKSNA